MIILIPVDQSGKVNDSFARASRFLIYDSETQEKTLLENKASLSSGGAGVKAAQHVIDLKVDIILTPRLGENAALILSKADIGIYKTINKDIEKNINLFLANKLSKLENFSSGH
ncbi:MAG: NifB/NifX family molybdenum-iron cluster-binding protein [Bacilli bacterium]|jgi:predicted Fe-Mo cluster-binding NifX family protein|nr:NifB/NifX family molybdenum-iron cluster-binding protein [Bacilli bacterium]